MGSLRVRILSRRGPVPIEGGLANGHNRQRAGLAVSYRSTTRRVDCSWSFLLSARTGNDEAAGDCVCGTSLLRRCPAVDPLLAGMSHDGGDLGRGSKARRGLWGSRRPSSQARSDPNLNPPREIEFLDEREALHPDHSRTGDDVLGLRPAPLPRESTSVRFPE